MKILKKGLLSFVITLLSITSYAQGINALSLNEIHSNNINGLMSNSGKHEGWIEIYNDSYSTVDIGGCYITDDKDNPRKYRLPQGNINTQIRPRQYIVIWADGIETHGVLYTNFKLKPNEGGYLALYGSNGRSLIEEINYPALPEDKSYAKDADNKWVQTEATPGMQNYPHPEISQAEIFGEKDKTGGVMASTAMSVVFFILVLLAVCFTLVSKAFIRSTKKKAADARGVDIKSEQLAKVGKESGEIYAAIALALNLYESDVHDFEHMVITIEKDSKTYSPWSSKWQGVRQTPVVRKR